MLSVSLSDAAAAAGCQDGVDWSGLCRRRGPAHPWANRAGRASELPVKQVDTPESRPNRRGTNGL